MKQNSRTVSVFNRQRRLAVATGPLQEFLHKLSDRLTIEGGFSVVLVSDRAMKQYYSRFAGKNRPTDVLSFPTDEADRVIEPYWGDILISVETADRQKRETLEMELKTLGLHGVLHLLGYDHESDQGEMERLEKQLRVEFGLA